jgi:hypothetical protein
MLCRLSQIQWKNKTELNAPTPSIIGGGEGVGELGMWLELEREIKCWITQKHLDKMTQIPSNLTKCTSLISDL